MFHGVFDILFRRVRIAGAAVVDRMGIFLYME